MSSLVCPVCQSTDLRRVEAESWRCNVCDTLFIVRDSGVVVRVAGRPPTAGPRATPWVVGLGLAALVAVGVGVWGAQVDPEPAASVPSFTPERPPPASDLRARRGTPDFQLSRVRRGETPDGAVFFLMSYRNLDRFPIAYPAAIATLYDESGKVVQRVRGDSPLAALGPGEETVVLVVAHRPQPHARFDVVGEAPQFVEPQAVPPVVLLSSGLVAEVEDGVLRVSGSLRNPADGPVRADRVVVVGRDEEGLPVAWGTGLPDAERLPAGASVGFAIEVGPYRIAEPAVWTAMAQAFRDDGQRER